MGLAFIESEFFDLSKIVDQSIDVTLKGIAEFCGRLDTVEVFLLHKVDDVRHDMSMDDMRGLQEDHIFIFVDVADLTAVRHRERKVEIERFKKRLLCCDILEFVTVKAVGSVKGSHGLIEKDHYD